MKTIHLVAAVGAIVVVEVLAAMAGYWDAYRRVQSSCDDPVSQTIINGNVYMCVTKEQWNEVAERIFRMGFATGAKSARSET